MSLCGHKESVHFFPHSLDTSAVLPLELTRQQRNHEGNVYAYQGVSSFFKSSLFCNRYGVELLHVSNLFRMRYCYLLLSHDVLHYSTHSHRSLVFSLQRYPPPSGFYCHALVQMTYAILTILPAKLQIILENRRSIIKMLLFFMDD
jgi:hypothetical protein